MPFRTLQRILKEADYDFSKPQASKIAVNYWVKTPKGSKAYFTRTISNLDLDLAMSETATLQYLQKLHPGTEITIKNVAYK